MSKFVARVTEVLHTAIHKIGTIQEGKLRPVADLPQPNRVEIVMDGGRQAPCMMYRYGDKDAFCGDSWHENLDAALDQAQFEYGLSEDDFTRVEE